MPADNPLRVLIVDDEPLARRGVRARLQPHADVEVVGECTNGREAVAAIRGLRPDVVFLDVQMPGMDGFGVVDAVVAAAGAEAVPVVVFVTAYDRHALRAFEVHALDYLLKPIDDDRFAQALDRARARHDERRHGTLGRRLAGLLADVRPGTTPEVPAATIPRSERFVVKEGGRIFFVAADEIDRVEAAGDYVCLHVGKRTHLLRETMTVMEGRLDPDRFLRIHRSTIVNADRIRELRPYFNGEYVVVLKDGTELKLSRTYRDRLQSFFDGAL